MEKWFEFTAFSSPAHYGFGTRAEADQYLAFLNSGSHRPYSVAEMSDEDAAGLESGDDTDGFRLDLALDAARENGWHL